MYDLCQMQVQIAMYLQQVQKAYAKKNVQLLRRRQPFCWLFS